MAKEDNYCRRGNIKDSDGSKLGQVCVVSETFDPAAKIKTLWRTGSNGFCLLLFSNLYF
jgi:hypothetical protein